MFDKSDELKSEDFLLFNILSLKELKVGLWGSDDELLKES